MSTISVNNPNGYATYPNNRILAIIDTREGAREALEALGRYGRNEADIEVLHGEAGIEILDADSTHHGLLARIAKAIRAYGDVENESMHIYEAALRADAFVFAIHILNDEDKESIRQILVKSDAREINYFSTWVVEALQGAA